MLKVLATLLKKLSFNELQGFKMWVKKPKPNEDATLTLFLLGSIIVLAKYGLEGLNILGYTITFDASNADTILMWLSGSYVVRKGTDTFAQIKGVKNQSASSSDASSEA